MNGLFRGITQSLQNQASQGSQVQKLEDLINKSSGLAKYEKEQIFSYVKNGDKYVKNKKEFITNVIMIFSSFFEYGFLNRSSSFTSSSGAKSSSYADEWADSHESGSLGRVEHYWEYITMQFS